MRLALHLTPRVSLYNYTDAGDTMFQAPNQRWEFTQRWKKITMPEGNNM